LPVAGWILVSSACGGEAATSAPPASATSEAATKGPVDDKQPAFRLGHYSSPDGFVALVLDRTGDKPKLRVDRSADIVELFVEDALDKGDLVGHWMNGPDGG